MINKMCMFQPEGEDDLKKMQLMELAIINGTFRDNKLFTAAARKCLTQWSNSEKKTNAVAWLTWQCVFSFYTTLQPEGEDDLKKRQLMELAIINGTYRDTKAQQSPSGTPTATATATSIAQATRKLVTAGHQVVRVLNPWRAACWIFFFLYQSFTFCFIHTVLAVKLPITPTLLGITFWCDFTFHLWSFTTPQLPHYSFYPTIYRVLMSSRLWV